MVSAAVTPAVARTIITTIVTVGRFFRNPRSATSVEAALNLAGQKVKLLVVFNTDIYGLDDCDVVLSL